MKSQLVIFVGLVAIILTENVNGFPSEEPEGTVCTCGLGLQSSSEKSFLKTTPLFDGYSRKYPPYQVNNQFYCDDGFGSIVASCSRFCEKLIRDITNDMEHTYEPNWKSILPTNLQHPLNKSLGQMICEQNLQLDVSKNPGGETVEGRFSFYCPYNGKTDTRRIRDIRPSGSDGSEQKLTCKNGMFTKPLREKPEPEEDEW